MFAAASLLSRAKHLTLVHSHLLFACAHRVSIMPDTKIPNAATLVVEREDHTLGNILRMQLLEDKEVLFSGYRVQHPLEPAIQIKVQTKSENPGPVKAVEDSLGLLLKELGTIEKAFNAELKNFGGPGAKSLGPGDDPMTIG